MARSHPLALALTLLAVWAGSAEAQPGALSGGKTGGGAGMVGSTTSSSGSATSTACTSYSSCSGASPNYNVRNLVEGDKP